MTREKAQQVVKELHDVLVRHGVLYDDDSPAGITMVEWVGEGPPPNPFTSTQYLDGDTWGDLGD